MVRPLRIDYPDTFYHILSRGNEREEIFRDEQDYLRSLAAVSGAVKRSQIYFWSDGQLERLINKIIADL